MGKEILTFVDNEIEKKKFFQVRKIITTLWVT